MSLLLQHVFKADVTGVTVRHGGRQESRRQETCESLFGLCTRTCIIVDGFIEVQCVHCVSKKVPTFKLSVTLSNLN